MIIKHVLRIFILITTPVHLLWAYSHGGPAKSCNTLYPGHGVDKQYGIAPYDLKASVGPSGNVIVSIVAQAVPFAGFMLQARLANDRETIVNGRFSEDKSSQIRNCNGDNPVSLDRIND